jgi:hypothetical protein
MIEAYFVRLFAVIIIVYIMLMKAASVYECKSYGRITGLETDHFSLTCMINDPDLGWVTYEERKLSRVAEKTGLE